jgi:hypothetical protein
VVQGQGAFYYIMQLVCHIAEFEYVAVHIYFSTVAGFLEISRNQITVYYM